MRILRGTSQINYVLEISGLLTQEHFIQAFHALFQRHPLLRSTINNENNLLSYHVSESSKHIPLNFYTTDQAPNHHDFFTQQLPLEQYTSAIAIIELSGEADEKRFEVLWHISHVVADGLSSINLLRELIALLDDQIDGCFAMPDKLPFYEKLEAYLPDTLSLAEFISQQKKACAGISNTELSQLANEKQAKKAYFTRELSTRQFARLQMQANELSVSLNDLINAALVHAYCSLNENTKALCFGSALNCRNKCKPKIPSYVCGNYFSTLSLGLKEEDLKLNMAELARRYREKLGARLIKGRFLPTKYDQQEMQDTIKNIYGSTKKTTRSNRFVVYWRN